MIKDTIFILLGATILFLAYHKKPEIAPSMKTEFIIDDWHNSENLPSRSVPLIQVLPDGRVTNEPHKWPDKLVHDMSDREIEFRLHKHLGRPIAKRDVGVPLDRKYRLIDPLTGEPYR